jgi:hypothetical protein
MTSVSSNNLLELSLGDGGREHRNPRRQVRWDGCVSSRNVREDRLFAGGTGTAFGKEEVIVPKVRIGNTQNRSVHGKK